MSSLKRTAAAFVLSTAIIISACSHKVPTASTPATTITTQQKMTRYNSVLATAVKSSVDVTTNLNAAGVIDAQQTAEILSYESSILTATDGIARVLASNRTWQEELPDLVSIAARIPPPTVIQKYTKMTDPQYAALIAALQGVSSAIEVIALEVQP